MIRNVLRPSTLLRALVLAAAAVVFCWPLTVEAGLGAAGLGAALGVFAGDTLAQTRLRLPGFVFGALLAGFVGCEIARAAVTFSILPRVLGPLQAESAGEAILWFSIVGPLAAT